MGISEKERLVEEFLALHHLTGPNFIETPQRVAKFWEEFLYPAEKLTKVFPLRTSPGMVILRGITLWGFCPHHLLPVRYDFKIGYIPEVTPLGASVPARLAQIVLSKLPLQEEVPEMLVTLMEGKVKMKGAGCIVQGEHLCMQMRGVRQPCSNMITDYLTGCFLDEPATRNEFLTLAFST